MSFPTVTVEASFSAGATTGVYLHLDDVSRGLLDTGTLAPDSLWSDISTYAQKITIRRGATRTADPTLRYEAGTAEIVLDNSDRRFDPTNLSGPYVSAGVTQVTPMRGVRVRATWDGVTYDLFRGFADDWAIDYDSPNYSRCVLTATDGTKVLEAFNRGAVAAVGGGENAGARVSRILNSASWPAVDRMISTGNTTLQSTTLAGAAWTELLLVQDTESGEIYVDGGGRLVFRNRQASMEQLRSMSPNAVFGGNPVSNVQTTINLSKNPSIETDTTGWIAGGSVPPTLAQSAAQAMFGTDSLLATWGTGGVLPNVNYDMTGLTVGRTYTASVHVYVPAGSPDVVTIVATTNQFGTQTGLKDQWVRLEWTGTVTAATMGFQIWPVTAPTAGQQVYLDGLQVEEGATVTTYCDGDQTDCEWDGTAHASTSRRLPELHYTDVTLTYDDLIKNLIRLTRVGGAQQTVSDGASITLYLTNVFERNDLIMQSDLAAADLAAFLLYQNKDPELRFNQITVMAGKDGPNLFPQVLRREFGDRIRVIKRPPGGGTITREVFIRGIRHEIEALNWKTDWVLQSATKWSFLTLDHATLGKLDENALGF